MYDSGTKNLTEVIVINTATIDDSNSKIENNDLN